MAKKKCKVIAKIKKDKKGLWLMISGDDDTAHPLKENEVEAVKEACEKYLQIK